MEAERMQAVRAYNVLDTAPERELDDITRIASYVFKTPIALISIVDEHRQWFKSSVGLEPGITATSKEHGFCAHAIQLDDVMVIPDATLDERFALNPLVVSDPKIRFYAGAPLVTPDGHTLGTLCVIDSVPRTLDDEQRHTLSALARQVMTILELRRSNHEQQEFLNAILDSMQDGVVACDDRGHLRLFNRATREFHGQVEEALPAGEWASKYQLFGADGITPLATEDVPLFRAFRDEQIKDVVMTIVPSDRPARIVTANGRALHDLNGRKIGAVVSMHDITERKHAEEFLATLSHELKTPMTSILGWVRILQLPDTDEQTRITAAQAIEESAMVQSRLVTDMLDVSSILAGKLPLTFTTVDLVAICKIAIESMRPALKQSGILLQAAFPEEPVLLRGDSHRLLQVFWNLISNSSKFTPDGGRIEIELSVREGEALVRVSDTGKGISRLILPYIFEKFRQANDSRLPGSLGLGLAIVRHIVEAHDGTIVAESKGEGEGASFTVTLPRSESAS